MADNVSITDSNNAAVTILADEVTDVTLGTGKSEYVKLMDGTLNSTNKAAIDASGRLAVDASQVAVPVTDNNGSLTVDVSGSVTVASIAGALPAGNNNIGNVDIATMPAASVTTDSIAAAPYAETSLAGATPYKLNSAATTNATSVKASTGKVYSIICTNQNAAVRYVKFYNKASAPTVGTDTPVFVLAVPGGGAPVSVALPMPLKFSTGIAFATTTGAADSDTTAVAANDIIINLGYA